MEYWTGHLCMILLWLFRVSWWLGVQFWKSGPPDFRQRGQLCLLAQFRVRGSAWTIVVPEGTVTQRHAESQFLPWRLLAARERRETVVYCSLVTVVNCYTLLALPLLLWPVSGVGGAKSPAIRNLYPLPAAGREEVGERIQTQIALRMDVRGILSPSFRGSLSHSLARVLIQ